MAAIAISVPDAPKRTPQPYAELKRRVEAAGLMRKRPGYYTLMLVTNAILFAGTLWIFTLVHSVWATALVAAALAFVSGQLGFQLHDSGHRQMFSSRRLNTVVGIVTGNGLLGMSHGWWVDKHNRHHGNPNHVDLDPDIDIGVISATRRDCSSSSSSASRGQCTSTACGSSSAPGKSFAGSRSAHFASTLWRTRPCSS